MQEYASAWGTVARNNLQDTDALDFYREAHKEMLGLVQTSENRYRQTSQSTTAFCTDLSNSYSAETHQRVLDFVVKDHWTVEPTRTGQSTALILGKNPVTVAVRQTAEGKESIETSQLNDAGFRAQLAVYKASLKPNEKASYDITLPQDKLTIFLEVAKDMKLFPTTVNGHPYVPHTAGFFQPAAHPAALTLPSEPMVTTAAASSGTKEPQVVTENAGQGADVVDVTPTKLSPPKGP
jgi:hypothetical protein